MNANERESLRRVFRQLHEFCRARQWRGIDPYDGLNSPVARLLPGKLARQAWTQLHKRSLLNLRPLCGIGPQLNSTSIALFALGSGEPSLLDALESLRTPEGGWGYPFGWQSRAFFAPPGSPNLICTALAIKALRRGERPADTRFVESLVTERDGERWIRYIPQSDTQVHNINMMGAALLGRRDCMEFSVKRQRPDGSWPYGEAANQQWIDNFHTGYCLVALKEVGGYEEPARRGFAYWDRMFWLPDGTPKYYHNATWPVDIHCCAQGILTYLAFGEAGKANHVARWAVENMWDARGFFWYQRGRRLVNRINYMRWSQAWMYFALSELIRANDTARR
jgi:hypothetical protein